MFSSFWKKPPQNNIEKGFFFQLHGYGPFSTGFSIKIVHPEEFDFDAAEDQIHTQIWNDLNERFDILVFDTGDPIILFKNGSNAKKRANQQELNQAAQQSFNEYMLSSEPAVHINCCIM